MPTRKKPNHLKALEGNHGKRPIKTGVTTTPATPALPLDANPAIQEMWIGIAPGLEKLGLLAEVDGPSLVIALGHAVLAQKALGLLLKEDLTSADAAHAGQLKKHPAAQIYRDNSTAFLAWSKELGLTVRARNEINLPEMDDSELERLLTPVRNDKPAG